MRYVIVSVVKGDAGEFNNNLRKEIWQNLRAKSSKLPAHFTIKAPFEYEGDISELESKIETFCKNEVAQPYIIEGYDHFDNRVIYMDVHMSQKGKAMHDRLIEVLEKLPYIEFTHTDGKDKVFHVTLSSKRIQSIYNDLWNYVNQYPCSYSCMFDNICIYKWKDNTWQLHREFNIK